ncbi:MAG: hypothetical protein LUG85_06700 [Clostridiales bacterium]|nr:hypothetical protein [Clostridiales bacterium]
MRKAKCTTKKALSVFLSLLMIMTSISVMFATTASAATYDESIAELAEALKSDTVANLSIPSAVSSSSGSGTTRHITYTTTIKVDTYAEYVEMLDLFNLINAAVELSTYYSGDKRQCTDDKCEGDSSTVLCGNTYLVHEGIAASLQEVMGSTDYAAYNVATLLDAVFYMPTSDTNYTYYGTSSSSHNNDTTNSNVAEWFKTVTEVYTDDVQGYLASDDVSTYDTVSDPVSLGFSYTITLSRVQYSSTDSCGGATYHYHLAFNSSWTPYLDLSESGINDNTEAAETVTAFAEYLDELFANENYSSFVNLMALGTTAVEELNDEITEKYESILDYIGSVDVFNKLYADYLDAFNTLLANLQACIEMEEYIDTCNTITAWVDEHPDYGTYNYGGFDYDTMVADYADYIVMYNTISVSDEAVAYLTDFGYFNYDYYTNFTDNVVVYDLAEIYEIAEALYNDNADVYSELTTEEQSVIYSALTAEIDKIAAYSEQVVNTIYPDGYQYLLDLQEELYCVIQDCVVFFMTNTAEAAVAYDTDDIYTVIESVDDNAASLSELYAEIEESSGSERADELLGTLVAMAATLKEDLYNVLNDRFASEVDFAYDAYIALGEPTTLSVKSYAKINAAFGQLEDDILEYLTAAGEDGRVTEETLYKYNYVYEAIYDEYLSFKATFGLNAYEQSVIEYESRDVYEDEDVVKTESYDVTEDTILKTVSKVDEFLTGDTFNDLIGTDLGSALDSLLTSYVYTDDMLNLLIEYLYPLVADEFVNVWAGLPSVYTVEDGSTLNSLLNSDPVNFTLNIDSVDVATQNVGLYLFPQTLGAYIEEAYPEYADVAAVLQSCTTSASKSPWKDSALYDEDGNLNLQWGITDKESFISAATAALSGLEPLLMSLLCNQTFSAENVSIGTGSGHAYATVAIITVTVDIDITSINLTLTMDACDGYNNALAPIFEALGVTAPDGSQFTGTEDIVRGILDPIEALIDNIAEAPLETVLSILPNLCYALSTDMISELLNMLNLDITYAATASYSYDASVTSGSGTTGVLMGDSISLNIGDMIDLNSLIDLSDGLDSIFALLGLDLPEIDDAQVATLGELVAVDTVRTDYIYDETQVVLSDGSSLEEGQAASVDADIAGVTYYILDYVVDLLKDTEAVENLLGMFLDDDVVSTVMGILDALDLRDNGDVIAAVVELLNAEFYGDVDFEYADTSAAGTYDYTANELYTTYWSEEKANYITDNFNEFVVKVCDLFGLDLTELLSGLIDDNLYSVSIVTTIVDAVNGLLETYLTDSVMDILEVVDDYINISITDVVNSLMSYTIAEDAFETGDRDAFLAALVDYITPVVPLLKLFLVDDANITAVDELVTIYSYNGYESAVIPILEALGCNPDSIVPYDEFAALSDEEMVYAVIDPVFELLDYVLEDPINNIMEILPNIIWFINSDGLQQSIDNLLRPVYAVLDVIRPVIDIDLVINLNMNEILADLLASAWESLGITLPGYAELSSIVLTMGTATTYTSATGNEAVYISFDADSSADFLTGLVRAVVYTLIYEDNIAAVIAYVDENTSLSDDAVSALESFLESAATLGEDGVLNALFLLFFGLDTGVDAAIATRTLVSEEILAALESIGFSGASEFSEYLVNIENIITQMTDSVDSLLNLDSESSITSFFRKIADFFIKIFNAFASLFKMS